MPESQPPNIVLIMVDDADRKVLQHEASRRIREAIADYGATATRYLINHPLCAPARASLLRGRYPHNTGVVGNTGAYDNFVANGGENSNIAVWLQAAGYRTAMIGKYLNGYQVPEVDPGVPPGWDYWFAVGQDAYNSYDYDANRNGTLVHYGTFEESPANYLTDVVKGEALEFLGSPPSASSEPFLLVVTPMAPHAPAVWADRHEGLYLNAVYPKGAANPSFNEDDVTDKPWYIAMLDKFDSGQRDKIDLRFGDRLRCMASVADLVEAIIEKLDEVPGRLGNTYVFFTSDHGFHMGEHRLGRDDVQDESLAPAPGGKNTMYEEDIRVPLWVRGPGIAPGTTVGQLVGNVDLAPTFLEIAGLSPVGAGVDGRSLLPLLHGQLIPWRTQYLISRGEAKSYAGIRSAEEWVFAELKVPAPNEIKGEYYDLRDPAVHPDGDPYELDNGYLDDLSAAERVALRAKVAAYEGCAGATCRIADST